MADNFKSQGTFALSHFRHSRASQLNHEPVYPNLFTVQIALPAGIGADEQTANLTLENLLNVGGLQSHTFPTTLAEQHFKWSQRRFAGNKPDKTSMDVTFDFEVNVDQTPSAYVVKTLRKWCDLVYDPLTGRTGLKVDYVSPWTLITLYDRGSRPFWQWKLYNTFPMSQLPAVELDYNSDTLYKITGFQLACDFWDETIV
jgi:hypothetical protein